jgi:hypothetical protein
MNRRSFLTFWRTAPVALPVLIADALAGDGHISTDGSALYLGGQKVLEQRPDGALTIGKAQNLHVMPPDENAAMLQLDAVTPKWGETARNYWKY